MIPVFDESGDVSNFVGFQVDLVERPQAINSKNPGQFEKPQKG
jgi:hypothetical protein